MAFSNLPFRGPTRVGNRSYAGQVVALDVYTRDIERIPVGLKRAYNKMLRNLGIALVANYRSEIPGRPNGRLGRQVTSKRLRRAVVVGVFNSEYAASLNRGFTSRAKKGKVLRFVVEGQVLYRPRTRTAGRRFHERAIASSGPIVEAVYDLAFYRVEDLA
jgi:hypothetical protein